MRTWQTILGVAVIIALLYVAFVVGAFVIRILLGLLVLVIAGWLIRRWVVSAREGDAGR